MNRVLLKGKINWINALRYTPSRVPVMEFSIAVVNSILEKKLVGYVTIVLFGKMAEKFYAELKIGTELIIDGSLWSRTYNRKRIGKYTEIKVVAREIFLTK